MIRKCIRGGVAGVVTVIVAVLTLTLLPGGSAQAAPVAAPVAATSLAVDCQHTHHDRPTKSGDYSDPCSWNGGGTPSYNFSIGLKWRWYCDYRGCEITHVLASLNICHRTDDPNSAAISVNAVSLNIWETKVAFQVNANPGPQVFTCDDQATAWVYVKGCGSVDSPIGAGYPQVVSVMGRGRGTLYASPGSPYPDFLRIPQASYDPDGYFDTNRSYYLVGRGGSCG